MKSLLLQFHNSLATGNMKKRGCIICHPLVLKLSIGKSNVRKMTDFPCGLLLVFG
jgi:hypothetical protein